MTIPAIPPPVTSTGLSEEDACLRLRVDGPNVLQKSCRHGLAAIAWEVVREPMFLLLIAAASIYLIMGEPSDAMLLFGFVLVVMGITILQERRTERAMDALRILSSPQALVLRDGHRRRIPSSQVVRGDFIVLAEGDRIPADGVLREGCNLSIDESLLTGESVPVTKSVSCSATAMDRPGGDDLASVYSGTLVCAGHGMAEVLATGARSELGRIGAALGAIVPERTRLQQETSHLVRNLALIGLLLCSIVVTVYALTRGGDAASWKQGLLAGITMAMAVLPEEFPVVLTIFLALGAWRLSHSRVLTRRMPAIETLGSATVLCTDKTGTLTRNQMTVARIALGDREILLGPDAPVQPKDVQELLRIATLACHPEPFDPMEQALHAARHGLAPATLGHQDGWSIVREYPLHPHLLAVSQAWKTGFGNTLLIASKGAPEAIAGLCGLSEQRREALARQAATMASDGLRVLGVAQATTSGSLPAEHHDLDLEFIGLIGLADPLRTNVPAAVAECRAAGIRVVMITGDYPATAQSIARQAGLSEPDQVITGPELDHLSDAELAQRIRHVQVFARVVPTQKLRLVLALKANHDVVAMTGDGVNDAPALKAAHIGIAMGGRGTDVARESAALVLLDDDFASIVAAIRLGRRIFDNIKKAVAFTFAVHVPIAGLSLLPVFIPDWPLLLLPVHIVFLELVIDPSCTLIFESEPAESDVMTRPPRNPSERLFAWRGIALSVLQGASALVVCTALFLYAHASHGADAARALVFTALVASFLAIIITNRSWSLGLLGILRVPNRAQWWVVLGTIIVLTAVLNIPIARQLFHFAPLHIPDLILAVTAGVLCVGWFEILKYLRRRARHITMRAATRPVGVNSTLPNKTVLPWRDAS